MSDIVRNFKGSVATVNDLPIAGNAQGDVWTVRSNAAQYFWSSAGASGDLTDWVLINDPEISAGGSAGGTGLHSDLGGLGADDHDGYVWKSPDATSRNILIPTDPAVTPLTVQGAVGQTANLQEWRNGDGDLVAWIGPDGLIGTAADLNVTGNVNVGGDIVGDGDLSIAGDTVLGGQVDITGTGSGLNVDNDVFIGGDLDVAGDSNLGGTVNISGTGSELIVENDVTIGGDTTIEGDTIIDGTLEVNNTISVTGTGATIEINGEDIYEIIDGNAPISVREKSELEMELQYEFDHPSRYKEFTYDVNENLSQINVYVDQTKVSQIFSMALAYDLNENLESTTLIRLEDSATLIKTMAYDVNENLSSINIQVTIP